MTVKKAIPIVTIVGPTASGKSDLAFQLAQKLEGEIISADSMQVYRGMDIGTAKPSLEMREKIPHHLIDILDPWESFNAAMFAQMASQKIQEIHAQKKIVFLVGGTALYIKSLLEGIFPGPSADWELRKNIENRPLEKSYEELCKIDPETAQKISPQDKRRIVRALEVYYLTGIPISIYQHSCTSPIEIYHPIFLGISWERKKLYSRIEKRVDEMFSNGLIEETKALLNLPHPISHTASQAIGYREVIEAIKNSSSLSTLPTLIKRNTRRFAKRQMTWWKRFPVNWFNIDQSTSFPQLVLETMKFLETQKF